MSASSKPCGQIRFALCRLKFGHIPISGHFHQAPGRASSTTKKTVPLESLLRQWSLWRILSWWYHSTTSLSNVRDVLVCCYNVDYAFRKTGSFAKFCKCERWVWCLCCQFESYSAASCTDYTCLLVTRKNEKSGDWLTAPTFPVIIAQEKLHGVRIPSTLTGCLIVSILSQVCFPEWCCQMGTVIME